MVQKTWRGTSWNKELKWECYVGSLVLPWRTGKGMMPSIASSSMHHGQGTWGEAEMEWAYTTERRRWLCQTNPRGRQTSMDNEVEDDRERDGPTSSSTTWRTWGSRWRTHRAEWRKRTRVADPSPEGFTAWRREREIVTQKKTNK